MQFLFAPAPVLAVWFLAGVQAVLVGLVWLLAVRTDEERSRLNGEMHRLWELTFQGQYPEPEEPGFCDTPRAMLDLIEDAERRLRGQDVVGTDSPAVV